SFYFPTFKLFPLYPVPDCRYPSNLANGSYSLVGASQLNGCGSPLLIPPVPTQFAGNTGDPVHRFFQMWQQNDCNAASISASNPSGCTKDLYTWVATSVGWQITKDGKPPLDDEGTFQGGIAMGFYNMAKGDYPYFLSLAQSYSINDNYHQFVMGGTGPNSQAIGTADVYYFTDSKGNPVVPPFPNLIENPDPQPGSNNFYTQDHPDLGDPGSTSSGGLVNCSDSTAPGVKSVQDYLGSLPYKPFNNGNCAANLFYQVDNEYPSFDAQGNPIVKSNAFPNGPNFAIGPQTIPTIGDALSAQGISWKYYGEGMKVANQKTPLNALYCAICNPFQYASSIMTTKLKNNLQDLDPLYADIASGNLPAVSFVKPDTLLDSHPGTSTPPLFEAFTQKIINSVQANDKLWKTTAILITFDESGGLYDSGYVQPIDFFGDGPRTVLIAVSPFAKFGFVDHTYSDHASIAKFIEKNWRLQPLSKRSRDNLPNPNVNSAKPYFPTNSPAIGDLTGMFDFSQ
ncbi:MAG TPA: alkaline phosphatase family protein, partial [Candidatus Binataceae bacterium]|nr:alkaline phosphatase family protein [Candidatus Binataceae bacterium]